MNSDWMKRLQTLCARYSYLGMGADLAAMSKAELRGLYRFLSRLAKR